MKNIKNLFVTAALLGSTFYSNAQDEIYQKKPQEFEKPKYYLGFSLMPNHNGPISYATIKVKKDYTQIKIITKSNFLLQALGKQTSKANPRLENLMEKNGIQDCTSDDCSVLDKLWKLTYSIPPEKILNPDKTIKSDTLDSRQARLLGNSDTRGWSRTNVPSQNIPSKEQLNLLKQFGIKNLRDFFYGDNAFELLKSVQNQSWVSQYENTW